MKATELLELYRPTRFIGPKQFSPPDQFAIVTPCNPLNQILTERDNQQRLQALEKKLQNFDYWPMTGCSADLNYQEPGYAINCSLAQAIQLGLEFQQNAIFWISQNALWVYPSHLASLKPCQIGQFDERLIANV